MLRMSPTPNMQKLIDVIDEFGEDNCRENEVKRASSSTRESIGADYPSVNHVSHIVSNLVGKNVSKYLTPDAKKVFNQLRQAFTKAPILQHFNPDWYIWVETDASGHAIGGVLSQLTNDLGQWRPVAYFLYKMISAKIKYKTHNGELLAIVEAFKTWRHYLEDWKNKVLVLTNHNNLCYFINIKNLSSGQVWWAQTLSRYHFRIDYC